MVCHSVLESDKLDIMSLWQNEYINPYPAKTSKWNNPPFWHCPLSVLGIPRWKLEVAVSQQYRAWSDCTDMKAGLVQR